MESQKIVSLIEGSSKLIILTHKDPDGDAIGSSLALFLAMQKIGKIAHLVCKDPLPKAFSFLEGLENFKKNFLIADGELLIIVDCGDLRRTGFPDRIKKYFSQKIKIINLDHHRRNDLEKLAKYSLVDPESASTAQIIHQLITKLRVEIDSKIATSLLAGVYYDTGGFRHANTDKAVLDFAAKMMDLGAEMKKIKKISPSHRFSSLKLWGYAFSKIEISKLGIAKVIISKKDLKNLSATQNDLLGLANMVASMNEVKIAIVLWETDEGARVMLRTQKEHIDVSQLARIFGGNGYKKAAGFSLGKGVVKF